MTSASIVAPYGTLQIGRRLGVRPRKIAVLLHEKDNIVEPKNYLIKFLIEEWKDKGLSVEFVRGTKHFMPADVIIPHLDLTVTPDEYRTFMAQYPLVINKQVVDISKSKLSPNIVERESDYAGPVIVKTDRNYGGIPERRFRQETYSGHSISRRIIRKAASRLRGNTPSLVQWKDVDYLEPGGYPVFSSLQQTPPEIFDNSNLIVEKFLPEIDGENYCLRYYYFFADKDVNILLKSKAMVIKGANTFLCRETPVPPELRAMRQQLGFDYGKFDYVLRDGKVVLFDVNPTPSYSTLETHKLLHKVARHLAEGIWAILNAGSM
jgi:hypothetical protein